MKQIKVSICCLTYNHKHYIAKALDGFLMQKTTFPIEILIHDDASTDGTAEIIREYEQKFPHLIKPIYQTENQYSKNISLSLTYQYPRATGKYIALCEGDDYWTDPYKLQKQVDFLEAHPDYFMVHTNYSEYDEATKTLHHNQSRNQSGDAMFDQLLTQQTTIATLTVLVCTDVLKAVQPELRTILATHHWPMGDYPLWLIMAEQKKKMRFFSDDTAVYRVRKGSVSHPHQLIKKLEFLSAVYDIKQFFLDRHEVSESVIAEVERKFFPYSLAHCLLTRNVHAFHAYQQQVRSQKHFSAKARLVFFLMKSSCLFHSCSWMYRTIKHENL